MMLWLLSIVSGLLVALSNAPYDQWYLAYVAFIPLFLVTQNESPVRQGLAYALCCTVIASNWWHSTIIYSFWFFALIVCLLCLSFFLWAYLSAPFRGKGVNPLAGILMPCVIWVGIEGILSSETVGIPCNIGISQSGQPVLIQSASLFGIYTTSFLIVLGNTTLAYLIRVLAGREQRSARAWQAIALGLAVFLSNYLYGAGVVRQAHAPENPLRVAVIQPVIESDLYLNGWRNPDTRNFIRDTLDTLTDDALSDDPDLLVWPEGGNGYLNMRIDELRDSLYRRAVAHQVDMLISSNDLDEDGRKYNSMFSISKAGKLIGRYDKVNLIPGAEDAYTAGKGFHTIPTSFGAIGPSICYESNFPSPLRKVTAMGAQLLVVSTSDAAFKKTSLTINHTRTAVFRAIENNRWVIHASNTGPSVIVSPGGVITAKSNFYERGYILGSVEYLSEKTIFTRYGYLLHSVFSIIVLLLLARTVFVGMSAFVEARRRGVAYPAMKGMAQDEMEARVRNALARIGARYLPFAAGLFLLLSVVVVSSIAIVHRQVVENSSLQLALSEFMEPINSLAVDKVTEKFLQAKNNSCGPAVMAYVLSYFGKERNEEDLIRQIAMTEKGTSMLELKNAAIRNGFQASGVKENYAALLQEQLPVVAYINDDHYVVVNRVNERSVYLFDPAIGHVQVPRGYFERVWNGYLLLVRVLPIRESYDMLAADSWPE